MGEPTNFTGQQEAMFARMEANNLRNQEATMKINDIENEHKTMMAGINAERASNDSASAQFMKAGDSMGRSQ